MVAGINVGAQPYWNAEATMLMHTRGILVMTPESAMVLTGKQALDYSGGVSAEDNQSIGGYERIMGRNGQAHYLARDLIDACRILLRHYDHAYVAPGERFPRPARTTDPRDRDVRSSPHGGELATIGDVFSEATNPGRKKPFDIRTVMAAVIDQDHPPLERWFGMHEAETAVVWDAFVGGYAGVPARHRVEAPPSPRSGYRPTAPRPGRRARSSPSRPRSWRGRSMPPAAAGPWWSWPTSPGSTARPSPCAGCSSSTAPRSVGPS